MTARALAMPAIPAWADGAERRLYSMEKWICVAALAVMLAATCAGVAIRFWGLPLPNVAEWAIVSMSPLTFVGAGLCTMAQAHISVDIVKQLRSASLRRAARAIVSLLMLAFAGIYAWLGWILFEDALLTGERLLDMGTPVAVPVAFLWAGMLCMMAHCLMDLWRLACGLEPATEAAP